MYTHVDDGTPKRPATTIAIRHHHYHRRRRRRQRRRPPPPPSSRNPLLLLRLLLHLRRLSCLTAALPARAPSSSLAPLSSSRPFFSASSSFSSSSSRASLLFFSVLCVLRARFRRRVHTRATSVCVCVRRTLGGRGIRSIGILRK